MYMIIFFYYSFLLNISLPCLYLEMTLYSLSTNLIEVFFFRLFEIYGDEDIYETESDDDEAAMLEIDELRSHRRNPLTKEQFEACFDECGRLIHEHELRKQIFKGYYRKTYSFYCNDFDFIILKLSTLYFFAFGL